MNPLMQDYKISIIVAIYNVEDYLKECIDSILAQTYSNFEALLVNDGSTDHSGEICDDFALKDNRIRVVHKANGGLSEARNYGIDQANGDFICFIDGDDYVHPEYIEKLYRSININNADIAICDFYEIGDGRLIDSDQETYYDKEVIEKQDFLLNYLGRVRSHHSKCNVVAWNKLIKKNCLKDLRFKVGYKHEDMFFIHHLINRANTLSIVFDKLYYYRQRSSSISNDSNLINDYHKYLAITDRADFYNNIFCNEERFIHNERKRLRMLVDLFNRGYHSLRSELLQNFRKIISYNLVSKRDLAKTLFNLVKSVGK